MESFDIFVPYRITKYVWIFKYECFYQQNYTPILKMEKVRFETLEKTVLSRQKKTHVTGNILINTSKKFNFKFVVKQT